MAFFGRIRTLLPPDAHVLDFGAGRGKFAQLDTPQMRAITDLSDRTARFAVFDVDKDVLENLESNDRHHAPVGVRLPFDDNSFDLIYSTWVAEHIADADFYCSEIARVVKPGGWFCALTPNKWGVIAIGGRLVPNSMHTRMLKVLQPHRAETDTFPTTYNMNTVSDIKRLFPGWRNGTYVANGPISYHANKTLLFGFWSLVDRLTPHRMSRILYIFVQKPGGAKTNDSEPRRDK